MDLTDFIVQLRFCERDEDAKEQLLSFETNAQDAESAFHIIYEATRHKYCATKLRYVRWSIRTPAQVKEEELTSATEKSKGEK
jgi:hypothetical protein